MLAEKKNLKSLEEIAEEIVNKIRNKYFFLFVAYLEKMQTLL